jgi:Ca2+-binding RTX toxin-like protein
MLIIGTNAADVLIGSYEADQIFGEDGADVILAQNGDDLAFGEAGNDVLDGGDGDDALDGGEGEDVLLGGEGEDQVLGGAGNDAIDGGTGDDFVDGGGGNDTLVSTDGDDRYNGGGGDDVHVVHGAPTGKVFVTDFGGIDTLDARGGLFGAQIDLRSGASSFIDLREVIISGDSDTTTLPVDLVLLQDLSGSFNDDVPTIQALVPDLVAAVRAIQTDSRFGLASFVDKPINPFGEPTAGDYVYQTDLGLTFSEADFQTAVNGLVVRNGFDTPESQIEALMQLGLRSTSELGYRAGAAKFVVLATDAPPHVAGDFGTAPPNNGDAVLDGGGAGEDYPTVAQVKAALDGSGVIPIFAVTAGNEAAYQSLVDQLGVGIVVTLSSDSSDIVDVISEAIIDVISTTVENAYGTRAADSIIGNEVANDLRGLGGHDSISGLEANDSISGGGGNDTLIGGVGGDVLFGDGAGGAPGRDVFDYNALNESRTNAANRDFIRDFRRADKDLIDLQDIDANSTVLGNQAFTFIGAAAFSGVAGELRAVVSGAPNRFLVSADVNGDKRADIAILVQTDVAAMADFDFVL